MTYPEPHPGKRKNMGRNPDGGARCGGPDRWKKTTVASVSKGAEKGRSRERERERRQSRGIKAKVAAEIAVTVHVRGVVVVTSFRFVGLGAEYDDDAIEKYGERLSKPQQAMPLS